jgi:hypothetical protein
MSGFPLSSFICKAANMAFLQLVLDFEEILQCRHSEQHIFVNMISLDSSRRL